MMPQKVFTEAERKRFGRCLYCEWHVPSQGHHRDCDRPQEARDAR